MWIFLVLQKKNTRNTGGIARDSGGTTRKPAELPGCFFCEVFLIDLCDFQPVVVSWIPSEKTFWP